MTQVVTKTSSKKYKSLLPTYPKSRQELSTLSSGSYSFSTIKLSQLDWRLLEVPLRLPPFIHYAPLHSFISLYLKPLEPHPVSWQARQLICGTPIPRSENNNSHKYKINTYKYKATGTH